MRVRGTCRSANRGGWLFLPTLYISSQLSFAPASRVSGTPPGQKGIESGQNRSKVNIYLLDFVSPRDFRRQQTAKSKHIFGKWCRCVVSCVPLVVVSTGVGVPAFEDSGPAGGWLWSSGGALPAFCPLYCIVLVVSLANMALFRVLRGFLARFGVRMYVYMGLGFCVACVAFVRVWS